MGHTSLNKDTAERILGSILGGRLLILCGAGLSMAPESCVPSAADLAEDCFHKCEIAVGHRPPDDAKRDLEKLTQHFLSRGELDSLFTASLVDWEPFNGTHNRGHAAIADLLSCEALRYGISTNIDVLIESAAKALGNRTFDASLDGISINTSESRFLKPHGSWHDRNNILWCHEQLVEPFTNQVLAQRIASSKTWLQGALPGRDLIFVGFWSDWRYLNDVLLSAMPPTEARLIVLVDPAKPEDLQKKAPELWEWAHAGQHIFIHEPQSGADFLDALRGYYSQRFMAMALDRARNEYQTRTGTSYTGSIEFCERASDEFYDLRRDICGVGPTEAVRERVPADHMVGAAAIHLMLRAKGATESGRGYRTAAGVNVSVINGSGRCLSALRARHQRRPDIANDVIICSGSIEDGGAAANIMRESQSSSVVRPKPAMRWITDGTAMHEGLI